MNIKEIKFAETAVISKFKNPAKPDMQKTENIDVIKITKTHFNFLKIINKIVITSNSTNKLKTTISLLTKEITSLDIISTPPK